MNYQRFREVLPTAVGRVVLILASTLWSVQSHGASSGAEVDALAAGGVSETAEKPPSVRAGGVGLQDLAITKTPVVMIVFGQTPSDDIVLSPAFHEEVASYSATVPYGMTDVTLMATARDSGSTLEANGTTAQGRPLGTQTTVNGLQTNNVRADLVKRFTGLTTGRNEIVVNVVSEDGSASHAVSVAVLRAGPDLGDDSQRFNFFRASANTGDVEGVLQAIDAGLDVDTRYEITRGVHGTAVVVAAMRGYDDLARALVALDANVNALVAQDSGGIYDGGSALMEAAYRGHKRIVETLLAAGADVNHVLPVKESSLAHEFAGASSLVWATAGGHAEIVGQLVDAGARVDHVLPPPSQSSKGPAAGATALFLAALNGNADIVGRLIDAGAEVNRPLPNSVAGADVSLSGSTPLMGASFAGHEEIVRLLLAAGAEVDYKVPRELSSGEKVNPKTAGLTAIKLAKRGKNRNIAGLLREAMR